MLLGLRLQCEGFTPALRVPMIGAVIYWDFVFRGLRFRGIGPSRYGNRLRGRNGHCLHKCQRFCFSAWLENVVEGILGYLLFTQRTSRLGSSLLVLSRA